MSIERFQRQSNPELTNESFVERDLFGKVTIESPTTRREIDAYRHELEGNFDALVREKLSTQDRAHLLGRGYRMIEGLWSEEQGIEPPKDILRDLRLAMAQRLELAPGHERDLRIFSAVGHPLEEVLGIDAIARIDTRGRKPSYISFGYETNLSAARGIADVALTRIPDEEDQGAYQKFLEAAVQRAIAKYRQQMEQEHVRPKLQKGRNPHLGKF
jgi:hypothetical protein